MSEKFLKDKTEAQTNIKKGFFWLGSANIIAQVLDVISSLIIIIFLTKAQMGTATIAWSIAVILESFNGLGVGTSMLQKENISENETYSLFWFSTGFAFIAFCVISALSPILSNYYNSPELTWMIIVSALKLPIVGIMLIPLQLLNKNLKYKEIGTVQTISSFLSSLLKISLAFLGFGAWALVLTYTASGIFMIAGVFFFNPFLPKLHFDIKEIKHHIIFGIKVTISGSIYHFYRNADYLIIGKIFGEEALGVYRVAFDIAMTPAMALLNVVNRASFPVFSKLNSNRSELAKTFIWTQKKLTLLTAPVAIFFIFTAGDIINIIGKEQWIEAVTAIRILAVAAFMRTIAQTFPQLFHSVGKPIFAIYDSLISLFLLLVSFFGFIALFGSKLGIISVCIAWVFSYPLAIAALIFLSKKIIPITFLSYCKTFEETAAASIIVLPFSFLIFYFRSFLPFSTWTHTILQALFILFVFLEYSGILKGMNLKKLMRKNRS